VKGPLVPALLTGVTAAFTLAACGVPPSDVIQAGSPASGLNATGPAAPASAAISLYFLHNGDLAPYPRKTHAPGGIEAVVRLLFDGPTESEAVTATTDLPRLRATPRARTDGDNTVVIQLPPGVPRFSRLGMRQLECTVAQTSLGAPQPVSPGGAAPLGTPLSDALPSARHPSLRVSGEGWTMTMTQSDGSCPDPSTAVEKALGAR
jgi:hypothetical protein